jgi:hypothetical protein
MKQLLPDKLGGRQNQRGSILISVAVHVVVIALIASITFSYPIAQLFGPREAIPEEHIQYVAVQPAAQRSPGSGNASAPNPRKPKDVKELPPAPLIAPIGTPSTLPPIPAPTISAGAGTGNSGVVGSGEGSAGIATGLAPALPDPRIELRPNTLRLPLTQAQRNDSAVKAIYLAYREAEIEAAAHQGKNPKDWTFEKGGNKYGLDSSYIYLGRFKLPSAILAALPFNYGGVDGRRIIDGRNSAWIQNDIYTHSQGLSEDDFRAAVKRIRERTDKQRKEAEDGKSKPNVVP